MAASLTWSKFYYTTLEVAHFMTLVLTAFTAKLKTTLHIWSAFTVYRLCKQKKNSVFGAPHLSLYCTQEAGRKSSYHEPYQMTFYSLICLLWFPNLPGTLNPLSHSALEYWDFSHVTICLAQTVFLLLNQPPKSSRSNIRKPYGMLESSGWGISPESSASPLTPYNLGQVSNLSDSQCPLGWEWGYSHINLAR